MSDVDPQEVLGSLEVINVVDNHVWKFVDTVLGFLCIL